MSRLLHLISCFALSIGLVLGILGCRPKQDSAEKVLEIGVITTLSGPARSWGEVTLRSAQVIADYHNSRGGVDVDGQRFQIELIVKDDEFDPQKAIEVARELNDEGIRFVIGPLGDEAVMSASRVLDSAGVLYVHYGFNQNTQIAQSLGVLGMPLPEQSLPVLLQHLRDNQYIQTVLVMAFGNRESIRQKAIAEQVIKKTGLQQVRLSRYDVLEETFGKNVDTNKVESRIRRIVELSPDVLLLTSCPPGSFVVLVDALRTGGYQGYICAQNFQDAETLAKLGGYSDGVYYVGGMPSESFRTDYYHELRERYLDIAEEWSEEAETKLYALEFILACIQAAGPVAIENTATISRILGSFEFSDPYYKEPQTIRVLGVEDGKRSQQIAMPIRISKMIAGESILVEEALE